jgi:hypothetical protein
VREILDRKVVNFDYGGATAPLFDSVMNTLVQQPDFRGIGGHSIEDHGGHGLHSQISIGMGTPIKIERIGKKRIFSRL